MLNLFTFFDKPVCDENMKKKISNSFSSKIYKYLVSQLFKKNQKIIIYIIYFNIVYLFKYIKIFTILRNIVVNLHLYFVFDLYGY